MPAEFPGQMDREGRLFLMLVAGVGFFFLVEESKF